MKKFHEWPAVLQRRWLLSGAAGLGFLAVGLVVFLALQDRALLMISALLALWHRPALCLLLPHGPERWL